MLKSPALYFRDSAVFWGFRVRFCWDARRVFRGSLVSVFSESPQRVQLRVP